jgi:hypothetical protein
MFLNRSRLRREPDDLTEVQVIDRAALHRRARRSFTDDESLNELLD